MQTDDRVIHALLAFQVPASISIAPNLLTRTPFFGAQQYYHLLDTFGMRVRPRIRFWGIHLLYVVEIQPLAGATDAWLGIFYGDAASAHAVAKNLDTAIKAVMRKSLRAATVSLQTRQATVQATIRTTIRSASLQLRDRERRARHTALAMVQQARQPLENICRDARKFRNITRYWRGSEVAAWQTKTLYRYNGLRFEPMLSALLRNPVIGKEEISEKTTKLVALVKALLSRDPQWRRQQNERHITHQAVEFNDLFEKVEAQELSDEQIEASLIFDDANVTVAAAGSGKTSVMVAKVAYALKAGIFSPDQILALAYNKGAAKQLRSRFKERLNEALKMNVKIEARTFHSLGQEFVQLDAPGKKFQVVKLTEDEGKRRFFAAFEKLTQNSESFRDDLLHWIAFARHPAPKMEPSDDDLEENERRYQEACRRQLHKKLKGEIPKYETMIPTLDPKLKVRSFEEAAIANWMILRRLVYRENFWYERTVGRDELAEKVGCPLDSKGKRRPYKPDFTYQHPIKKQVLIYHEHFGLNKDGKAPAFMGGEKYAKQAERKREAFRHVFGWVEQTDGGVYPFFETTSAQIRDGTIFAVLEKELQKRGIKVGELDRSRQYDLFAEFRKSTELDELFIAFLARYRDSGLSEKELYARAAKSEEPYRAKLFLQLVFELAKAVEKEYRDNDFIDYSDMLKRGAKAISLPHIPSPYKFILVDEFQDIAIPRMNLVRAIAARHSDSVLFFVGDDWQSINRFGGSDIAIFRSFVPQTDPATGTPKSHRISECGRSTHAVLLSNTYRCAQGIADVARAFVMKNGGQIPKKVNAILFPATCNTIRVVEHLDTAESRLSALHDELERLAALPKPVNKGKRRLIQVFILSRNKVDTAVPDGFEGAPLKALIAKFNGRLTIQRDSFHGSKGREADYTIIGGMDSGYCGFPSEMTDEPLLDMVLPPQPDPLEEERRLMYVGLTRSRCQTILLTAATRPSEYILELEQLHELQDRIEWKTLGIKRHICPRCRRGTMQPKWKPDRPHRCSRYPKCGYSVETL